MPGFKTRQGVRRWLRDKPREAAVVIAARAALRIAPLLGAEMGRRLTKNAGRTIILPAFRGMAAPWVAGAWPGRATELAAAFAGAANAAAGGARAADDHAPSVVVAAAAAAAADNTAIADAADAAAGAASYYPEIEAALAADLIALETPQPMGLGAADLAIQELWPTGTPHWAGEAWQQLRRMLVAANQDWEVWTDWYDARLNGAQKAGLPIETLEVARVLITDDIWWRGPEVVNPHIRRLIEERGIFEYAVGSEPQRDRKPPEVPAQRRAAVEPIWVKGRLTIAKKSAETDLSKKQFTATLSALRINLREFSNDIAGEANIDKRFISLVETLVERIPRKTPTQQQLFQLGHVEEVLSEYAATVDEEWPRILASRYHAVSLQFDRTMRQSSLWREFKRNAAKETLTADQVAASMPLAIETAMALRQDEATEFVESDLPSSLEQLANTLPIAANPRESALDAVEAGKELLAADLVESVNNTLKPIAEVALSAGSDYGRGFGKGFKAAAKQQGPKDGEKTFKWLRRITIAGLVSATGTGSFVVLSQLIARYPEQFAWLVRVLRFLQ